MKPKLLLRIAAILIFIHAALHTIGFSQWKHDPDPAKSQLIKLMTGQRYPFMGTSRNIGEYYDGFGYAASIALILIAVLFWLLSGSSTNPSLAKKITLAISLALVLWAVDEVIYFFPFAAGLTTVAAICGFCSLPGFAKQEAK